MWKGDFLDIHKELTVVQVEDPPPCCCSPTGRLAATLHSPHHPICFPPCLWPWHGEADGSTPPSAAV